VGEGCADSAHRPLCAAVASTLLLCAGFMQSQGRLKRGISHRRESANPKGATVTANVLFENKAPIKVHYALILSKRRIVSRTWQLDPKLSVAVPARVRSACVTCTIRGTACRGSGVNGHA
jgi:hypothetical protein